MKTLFTLLLAFGLCFTVHAQNNANIVNYQNVGTQVQSQLETLLIGNQNRLLLQAGFSSKQLGDDNQGVKLIQAVGSDAISNEVLQDFAADYTKVKAIVLSNIKANSTAVQALDLTAFNDLQYILIETSETLTTAFVQNLLQNVQIPANVVIVYKKEVLM